MDLSDPPTSDHIKIQDTEFEQLRKHKYFKMVKKAMGAARKVVAKIDHKGRVSTQVLAQMATPAPPLGSQLGAIGVNIAAFVKDFNLKTSIYKEGTPLPCLITVNPDRSHNLTISHPPFQYFIKQAAGIQRGAMKHAEQVAGYITRRHVYEIAKIKSQDELWQEFDLQVICKKVIDDAYTMGVHVVDDLDPKEYGDFLEERQRICKEERDAITAAREAKLLRTL